MQSRAQRCSEPLRPYTHSRGLVFTVLSVNTIGLQGVCPVSRGGHTLSGCPLGLAQGRACRGRMCLMRELMTEQARAGLKFRLPGRCAFPSLFVTPRPWAQLCFPQGFCPQLTTLIRPHLPMASAKEPQPRVLGAERSTLLYG